VQQKADGVSNQRRQPTTTGACQELVGDVACMRESSNFGKFPRPRQLMSDGLECGRHNLT
jgi:hypothetical protein